MYPDLCVSQIFSDEARFTKKEDVRKVKTTMSAISRHGTTSANSDAKNRGQPTNEKMTKTKKRNII